MGNNKNIEALGKFLELLRTDIITLSDKRAVMSESSFAREYGVSTNQVKKHMGQCPPKSILVRQSRLVILDKEEVHKYRSMGWSDMRIAAELKTSNAQVSIQCGSRKENGFARREVKKYKQTVDERGLKQDSWPKSNSNDEYWRNDGNVVQVGERPITELHNHTVWTVPSNIANRVPYNIPND